MDPVSEADAARLNGLSNVVIGAALSVHSALGIGLLESAYKHALGIELRHRGIVFERERPISVAYRGVSIEDAYKLDFLIEACLVLEAKAVPRLVHVHTQQLVTYLRLSDLRLGLLINFHEPSLRNGIRRIVNRF